MHEDAYMIIRDGVPVPQGPTGDPVDAPTSRGRAPRRRRGRLLAAAELDAAADGLLDREAVAAGLETAGLGGRRVEDAGLPARVRVQTLADGLLVEAAEHGVRLRLGDRQFRRVEELGRPTYQVPALPCGIDLGALYELAERLRDQGLA